MKHRPKPDSVASLAVHDARYLLDEIREALAKRWTIEAIEDLLASYGVRPLVRRTGDAHDNPLIDHCGICSPRWGWVEGPLPSDDSSEKEGSS